MLLSVGIIGCNCVDTDWVIVALMALSFFGKGFGAFGWAVMADAAPREVMGLPGGIFIDTFGVVAGIVTPIVIGYIHPVGRRLVRGGAGLRRPERARHHFRVPGDRRGHQAHRGEALSHDSSQPCPPTAPRSTTIALRRPQAPTFAPRQLLDGWPDRASKSAPEPTGMEA